MSRYPSTAGAAVDRVRGLSDPVGMRYTLIPIAAAGLCLTACGPAGPGNVATEGPATNSSESSTAVEPTTANIAGSTGVGTTSDATSSTGTSTTSEAVSSTGFDPDPDPDPDYPCECFAGEVLACHVNGLPGGKICNGLQEIDYCNTWWSECYPCERGEPLPCNEYNCYGDDDCYEGEECNESNFCVPIKPIPTCDRQPLSLSPLSFAEDAWALAIADVDGDGALDIAAVLAESSEVEVVLGDGAGGLSSAATYPTGLTPGGHLLATADFDGDGSLDIAVTSDVGELSLLFGQAGVFAAPVISPFDNPLGLWAGDVDGDGKLDLLARHAGMMGQLSLRTGDGLGGFSPPIWHKAFDGELVFAAVGSVDGDARLDVALLQAWATDVQVLEFAPGFGFVEIAALPGIGLTPFEEVAVGDIDGDALDDVVAYGEPIGTPQLQTWPQLMPGPSVPIAEGYWFGTMADVDGDGRDDLVIAAPDQDEVRVVFFDEPCVQVHKLPAGGTRVVTGDLDGDGKADLAVTGFGLGTAILRTGP